MMTIRIKYFNDKLTPLTDSFSTGDWVDLRCAEDIEMKQGDFKYIPLGFALQLPIGYEALVIPRSSTFKNFGILQANSVGLIDNSYCGDDDQWHFPAFALRDTHIPFDSRICQFRIIRHQPSYTFLKVDSLGTPNRGGLGSSGVF